MAADLSQVNLAFLLLRRILTDEAAVRREALATPSPVSTEVPAALPSSAQRHFERGVQFLRRTLPGEAIPCFQECLRLEPEQPQAHACLGIAYLNTGQARPAREHFRRALSLDPTNALANRFLQAMEAPRARPEPTPTVQSKSVPVASTRSPAPTQAPGLLQRVLAFFRGRP
jgi:tetratricopeptide (TPR) repeat protein